MLFWVVVLLVVLVVLDGGGGCDGSVRNSSWLEHRKQEWQELSLASYLQFDCFLFIKMRHWASVRQYEDR